MLTHSVKNFDPWLSEGVLLKRSGGFSGFKHILIFLPGEMIQFEELISVQTKKRQLDGIFTYIWLILYGKLVGMFVPIKPRKQPNRRISSKRQCELSVGKWFIFMVCGGVLVGKYAGYFTLFDEYIYIYVIYKRIIYSMCLMVNIHLFCYSDNLSRTMKVRSKRIRDALCFRNLGLSLSMLVIAGLGYTNILVMRH